MPSTLSSQVGKGPEHLSKAAPTPIPQLGPQPLPLRLPCNHSFLFGAENRPGQWGRGAAIPLARACSGVRGPEVKATRPPGILGGWEPREGGRRGVSHRCSQDVGDHEREQQVQARWSRTSPDPAPSWGESWHEWEQGGGTWESSCLWPPCPPPQTQNHKAACSWAGAQSHSASVPPRRGKASLGTQTTGSPVRPPGPSQPTGTRLGPSRILPASIRAPNPPPQERTQSPSPGSKAHTPGCLPAFIHSLFHSFKPRNSGLDTKLALGVQQRTRQPQRLPLGAHGLSAKHSDSSPRGCVTPTKSLLLSEPQSLSQREP